MNKKTTNLKTIFEMAKIFKGLIKILVIFSLILAVFFCLTFILINDNFDIKKLNFSKNNVEFYSNDGTLLCYKSTKTSDNYVKIDKLNKHTIDAFIAIEDRRFFSHGGIDYKRIAGAIIKNLKTLKFTEGASTITQQLVKNTYLTNEKSIYRKLKEIKIAKKIEQIYTKNEILEAYLNTIYFGKGAYGLQNASITYFNKNAEDLSINESALLAGIIKAPSTYSPISNYEKALNRKNVVLKSMEECNFITNALYNKLKNEGVYLAVSKNKSIYDDYLDEALSQYENSSAFSPYHNKTIKIYTFLDENLQREISKYNVENYQTSKIVINSKNNGIIAYFGNNSNLKRSPASCVKPFLVYAPCIEEDFIKQSTVLFDEETNFSGYKPKNYGGKYYGKVTVKDALIKSLNVPAVKLLNDFTICRANKYTKLMDLDIENESLTSALGAIEGGLTLKELTDKYSVFNSGGNYTTSSFIKSIYLDNIKIFEFLPKTTKVFSEETAFLINDILKESTKTGTSKRLKHFNFDLCAKTGTNGGSFGNIDAYSISYTTNHLIGVWVGNLDNSPMPNEITGGNHPTIITEKVLSYLYKNNPPSNFVIPTSVKKVKIDSTSLFEDNLELLSENGTAFYYKIKTLPTKNLSETKEPNLVDYKVLLKNGSVTIDLSSKYANKMKIIRIFNNKEKIIYSGSVISKFVDNIYDFGEYSYKIELLNDSKITTFKLPSVNFTINSLDILKDDRWLYD